MAVAFRTLRPRKDLFIFKRFLSDDVDLEKYKLVPWHKKMEWKSSKLNVFAPDEGKAVGPDFINFFRGPASFKEFYNRMKENYEIYQQRFIPERHSILGNDLATAHFIVHRGGAVKFCGQSEWIKKNENDDYSLPDKFVSDMYLEAVDASNTELRYEGLSNFVDLKKLTWLGLRNCKHIDDWCLDRITGEMRGLEYLDLSDCFGVTYRGLTALYRLEKLKVLKVNNIATSKEFQFTCLMLEDINPHLLIEGVKYIDIDETDS